MTSRGDISSKRQRRLFSFDSTKSSSSSLRTASETSDNESVYSSNSRQRTAPVALEQVDESFEAPVRPFESHSRVASNSSSSSSRPESPNPRSRFDFRKPLAVNTDHSRAGTLDGSVPRSPGLVRWDNLRHHVVAPSSSSGSTQHAPTTSSSSSSAFSFGRTQTPKASSSRFAQKLGFRQVVEDAQAASTREYVSFEQELERMCWAARSTAEVSSSASKLIMAGFMSTSSLAAAASVAPAVPGRPELRRPPSMQSLVTSSARTVPSLRYLYQTLIASAALPKDHARSLVHLPIERHVLSTLLHPYLSPEKSVRVDEDRWFSFESFEAIVKTWPPRTEELQMARCQWCCKAAMQIPHSPLRIRIMRLLRSLLNQAEFGYETSMAGSVQSLASSLFTLLPVLQGSREEQSIVTELIVHLSAGDYGEMDPELVEEELGVPFVKQDKQDVLRQALILETLARCLENSSVSIRKWLLENAVDEYWPRQVISNEPITPLLALVQGRKLASFTRGCLVGLRAKPRVPQEAEYTVHFTQTRVVPELHNNPNAAEARRNVVSIILELLMPGTPRELALWAMTSLSQWHRETGSEWKDDIEATIQRCITDNPWPGVIAILSALIDSIPEDVRKPIVALILPTISDRLVDDPPPHPYLPLTGLLERISQLYPPIFYKPLFLCAAATKDFTVINHLCAITAVSRFLPDYWTRDPEMISVALMRSGAGTMAGDDAPVTWGTARLGQSVLLVEMIGRIQAERRARDGDKDSNPFVDISKFAISLETRLHVLLEAKERTSLLPLSQRMLINMLFREIRLLTRSLKPAPWLPRMLKWFVDSTEESQLNDDSDLEIIDAVAQIQGLYAAASDNIGSSRQKNRGTLVLSAAYDGSFNSALEPKAGIASVFAQKEQLVMSLRKGFAHKALKLLVTMSTLLTVEDHLRIGPLVWEHHLSITDPSIVSAACFLVMQSAEKTPREMMVLIEFDLRSSDDTTRLNAVRRINTLSNWRFQIMSQQVIVDRNRRAFRHAREPLAFVATDIGSPQYVLEEDLQVQGQGDDKVPAELRKRLVEIGWAPDDQPVDQHLEWIRTPISNLPGMYLDRLEVPTTVVSETAPSPAASPRMSPSPSAEDTPSGTALLRRNSSTGGPMYGVKRRAIFVPTLAAILPRLALTVFDPSFLVAATARSTSMDLMRNDPALLTRPALDLLSGHHKDMGVAISTFRAFLHVRRILPPPVTHNLFNSLAGFLKSHLKQQQQDGDDALSDFALTMPVLAKLVTQVSEMSIREIRRAKIEAFLIPTGSLWFPSSAPTGTNMFPRSLGSETRGLDEVPGKLIWVSIVRLSQNMLFISMLKRNPQDVQLIRKSMTRLVLPSLDSTTNSAPPVDLRDFLPVLSEHSNEMPSYIEITVTNLSTVVSRSYLLLIAQVFRSMSRHLNDRSELAVLVDGLNRILLAHGSDIGVVAHALIALMVASTRFRRLFTTGGGYTLFIPALLKVYTEAESHPGIRTAIEYAFNRFYALHREAFVFQSIDALAGVISQSEGDAPAERMARNVHTLFATLTRPIPNGVSDAAGIAGVNKLQEKEALLFSTADEKPQTFLAALKKTSSATPSFNNNALVVDLPEEYETKRLGMDNFIRLFLTVIAHDTGVIRAQQFLRLLRWMVPYLHHANASTRTVLKEGVDALGVVLMRPAAKSSQPAQPEEPTVEALLEGTDKLKTASDPLVMRLDYLHLIVAFAKAGGLVSPPASHRALEIAKYVLRDGDSTRMHDVISEFVANYAKYSLERAPDHLRTVKSVVAFLADMSSFILSSGTTVDFSGVFDAVAWLIEVESGLYAGDALFARVVVQGICAPALAAACGESGTVIGTCRPALVSLVERAVVLRSHNVLAEIERRQPSYEFLMGFVMPFVMKLRTGDEAKATTAIPDPRLYANAWVRMLSYTMAACQQQTQSQSSPVLSHERSRSKSPGPRQQHRSAVPSFVAALQVLKIILIRGERDLTSTVPGVWARVGAFLTSLLGEGGPGFISRGSGTGSPMSSPRASFDYDAPVPMSVPLASPRIVDYTLWSFLELLCALPTPLRLQMHLFAREKVAAAVAHAAGGSVTPTQSRPTSTAFSKPRRRSMMLQPLSPDTSPKPSPRIPAAVLDPSNVRVAGYLNQPSSPHASETTYSRKIVHLGPISHPLGSPTFNPSSFPSSTSTRWLAKSSKIRSLALVRATYRRIRVVQRFAGCRESDLIRGGEELGEAETIMWTRSQALDAVLQETQGIMEEFDEAFWGGGTRDSGYVVVEGDQSFTSAA